MEGGCGKLELAQWLGLDQDADYAGAEREEVELLMEITAGLCDMKPYFHTPSRKKYNNSGCSFYDKNYWVNAQIVASPYRSRWFLIAAFGADCDSRP